MYCKTNDLNDKIISLLKLDLDSYILSKNLQKIQRTMLSCLTKSVEKWRNCHKIQQFILIKDRNGKLRIVVYGNSEFCSRHIG
jgi:hypothetical protein